MSTRGRKGRIEWLGVVDEAVSSLSERKSRTLLTGLGTVLGVGVLVSVLGLTSTASSQIDSRFTALSATEVTITQISDDVATRAMVFPDDFEQRVKRIQGVQDVGLAWRVPPELGTVRSGVVPQVGADDFQAADVMAASPGALRVARAAVSRGRTYDDYAQQSKAKVAVVGPTVAVDLGIVSLEGRPSIRLGGITFTVIGILGSADRHPELLNSIVVPSTTARALWGDPAGGDPPAGWVQVDRGSGQVVAKQLAAATSSTTPERFEVIPPPDPRKLRGAISSDLQGLFLILAVVCLIVGMVGIANTTFVTVMERLGEIGLRRALGARRLHIAAQFLTEATVIGLLGGLLGALLGLGVVVGVAVAHDWTAVVPPMLVVVGPAIGAATALVAAVYPALRGARTEPIVALRVGAQ